MYYEFFLQNVVFYLFPQTLNLHYRLRYVILIKIVFFLLDVVSTNLTINVPPTSPTCFGLKPFGNNY